MSSPAEQRDSRKDRILRDAQARLRKIEESSHGFIADPQDKITKPLASQQQQRQAKPAGRSEPIPWSDSLAVIYVSFMLALVRAFVLFSVRIEFFSEVAQKCVPYIPSLNLTLKVVSILLTLRFLIFHRKTKLYKIIPFVLVLTTLFASIYSMMTHFFFLLFSSLYYQVFPVLKTLYESVVNRFKSF
ncbi:hypothetical protein RCL1_005103 [Eukaryota sp. TZLM3-RCL]